jgi:putative hydrolase of the HAD superfamily
MVDVDGVIVRPQPGGWAVDLEADLGLAPAVLQDRFFRAHWDDIVLGRAGLHERLSLVLAVHAPHLTSAELASYWFAKDAQFDETLLADLAAARARGVQLHLATVQEHERARHLWETLGLRDRFDAMHYAADLGWKKSDPEFYAAVEVRTGFAPGEMLLLDDTPGNVDAARLAGWRAACWTGKTRLLELLPELAGAG